MVGTMDMSARAGGIPASKQPGAVKAKPAKSRLPSVALPVIFILVVVASLMLIGLEVLNFRREETQEQNHLRLHMELGVDQLAQGLSLPLWNFDQALVDEILDSEMKDPSVSGLTLTQMDPSHPGKWMTIGRARGTAWESRRAIPDLSDRDLIHAEREITYQGQSLGRLRIAQTTRFMDADLSKQWLSALVLGVTFDLLLVSGLYLLLWWVVLKPLRSIERYADGVKAGNGLPPELPSGFFHGEIESLRNSIGDMVDLLRSRLESVTEKETTLVAVLNSVPQAIYWRAADGRYLGCNHVFAKIAGLESAEDVIGRTCPELPVQKEVIAHLQGGDLEVIHTGVPRIHSVDELADVAGDAIWLDTIRVPIQDAEGSIYAVLGVFEDITERKLAEREHAHLQEQFNQSQKLESIGRLAGGVAHDNNNILTAILLHVELLRELVGSDEMALDHLKAMEDAVGRSSNLIRQLLAFSRKQVIEPRIMDLNESLVEFQKSMALLIGEDIHFALNPGVDLWRIKVDPTQVDQIIMNLAVNARDAMPDGGTLSIETNNVRIDDDYCRENVWASPGDYVVLSVSDTGIGMSAEVRQKIFEPFFTTKEVGKGTGLGLATIFGIVKQNAGFINVYSEPGLGATFRIFLPRFAGESPLDQVEEIQSPAMAGSCSVLVVEDDQILRNAIPRILDRLGFSTILADSPENALALCRQGGAQIDILLTDVVMPGMSGKELWEQVHQLRPDIQVVYMSGYTADVISRQGVLDDGVHFIQKPFTTAELGKMIMKVQEAR